MTDIHALLSTPLAFELMMLAVGLLSGAIGAVLGIGGGIVVIPVLTLLFGVNIRYAIGASLVSVIATSSGAAATYVKDHVTNLRVAMLLEIGTTIGALSGAVLTGFISTQVLYLMFAVILSYSAVTMLRGRRAQDAGGGGQSPDPWAARLRLHSSYPDAALGRNVDYQVQHVGWGLLLMLAAGLVSALLGIGSGSLKVPAMDQAMKLPIKVSSATSNFMMGVTAAASAGSYLMRGWLLPTLVAPVAVGVACGAWLGALVMMRLPSAAIRRAFVVVLMLVAGQMAWKGLHG